MTQSLSALIARVSVGVVFFLSGWGKLNNLPNVVQFFKTLGIPLPEFHAPFVATVELICGILLTLGLFTRPACIPLIITMIVALFTAKYADIDSIRQLFGMAEYLYIVILFGLIASGPGIFSLDYFIRRRSLNR